MDEEIEFCRADPEDETGRVVDASGSTICVCGSRPNAEGYAALLNQAYRRGYKTGYRVARKAARSR